MNSQDRVVVQEILNHALSSLRMFGWNQGHIVDKEGRYCALGAVWKASNQSYRRHDDLAVQRLGEVVIAAGYQPREWEVTPRHTVVGWNDVKGRTFEEVEEAFERAIEGE